MNFEVIPAIDVSGGRLTLGIGAGGDGWDATMLGQVAWSPAERAQRFAEFLELTDRLLREPATSFRGRFYTADEARTYPGCVQRPRIPFAVAATGPRGMRLAATYGETWVTNGDRNRAATLGAEEGAAVVGEQMARLDESCVEVDRDPASLRRLVLSGPRLDAGLTSIEAFRHTVGCYADVGHRLRRALAPVPGALRRRRHDLRADPLRLTCAALGRRQVRGRSSRFTAAPS